MSPSSIVKTTQSVSASMQPDSIIIYNNGVLHNINREPYETNIDVYRRGWYIINNKTEAATAATHNLYSLSLIEIYKNKGMTYDM
uniref:Uncharacterized protein n=1 Tax=viral metagenome TaxID=1070528 RepID=A0A6C0K7H5_9ZZZZ